jgi:glycosyltransferase involved in cell wall biosynthesis
LEIHQILVAAASGDAITNEALKLRDLLRRTNKSEIYAHHIDPRVPGIKRLSEYAAIPPAARAGNILVYHSSIGEPAVADFLSGAQEPLVLRYHNMTPAEMIAPFDMVLARSLEQGRRELAALSSRAGLSIAVSQYNAAELRELGFADVRVVPLLMDLQLLREARAEPGVGSQLLVNEGEPLVSFVGRVAPNKGHPALIQAFHVLKTYHRPDAHMFIVGAHEMSSYRESLVTLMQQLSMKDLLLTGAVSLGQLADVYRRTDVFLSLSAHEGFCAPLIEAMSFGVPIVALAEAAVPETVGDAALLLDEPSPTLAAEAVRLVLDDRNLRDQLVERGRRRVLDFDPEHTGEALVGAILAAA